MKVIREVSGDFKGRIPIAVKTIMVARKPDTNIYGFCAMTTFPLGIVFNCGTGFFSGVKLSEEIPVYTPLFSDFWQNAGGKLHLEPFNLRHHFFQDKVFDFTQRVVNYLEIVFVQPSFYFRVNSYIRGDNSFYSILIN